MTDSEYSIHFRNADIPFVIIELMFKKGAYGDFDYVVLYKDTLTEGYLSKAGLLKTRKFGLQLLKNHKKVHGQMIDFKKKLDTFSYTNWDNLKKLIYEFGKYYRYCEQPMLAGIEDIFENNCDNVEECLKHPGKCRFKGEGKLAHEILDKFGKMKYDYHVSIEKPIVAVMELLADIPDSFNLTEKEIDKILKNNKLIKSKTSGKKKYLNVSKRNGIVILKAKVSFDYDYWKNKVNDISKQTVLTGRGVSRGKIVGKVKVFISSIGYTTIPKGTIIVSGMTNPQMVPYMKNAVGIVTDEGGLTCHAAIIARELNIPAVVGTKHATRILKDGDIVEVDAEKGTVKKI